MSQLTSLIRKVIWSELHFSFWQRLGVNFTKKHYSSPIPDLREIRKRQEIWNKSSLAGIDFNTTSQLYLLENIFPNFKSELNFTSGKTKNPHEFYLNNTGFGLPDAGVLHCMIRHFKPKKIIEIGAGNSTLVSARASLLNKEDGIETQLISIEPYPKQYLLDSFDGLEKLIVEKVENMGVDFFDQLEDGDILFIDTSHVLRIGNDVNFLFLEVLPRLKKGVIVHIHDIFLPYNYPKYWILNNMAFLSEQYILQAFLSCNKAFEILFANYFMSKEFTQKMNSIFIKPDRDTQEIHGGSFWIRRI
ncbi:class I SAM-dependent methyltransferase [Planctomycetota bacterium]